MGDARTLPDDQQYYIRIRGRILGPFSIDKLKSLRSRGQFSRIHEVSTDRRAWSPASSIDHMISPPNPAVAETSGKPADSAATIPGPTGQSPMPGHPSAPGLDDSPIWYYRTDDQQFGPAATSELRKLIGSGRVNASDFVWKNGMLAWMPVHDVPELSAGGIPPLPESSSSISTRIRKRRRASRIALGSSFVTLSMVVAAIYFDVPKKLGIRMPVASGTPAIIDSAALDSIEGSDAERRLGECIGLVVTGTRATLLDGSVVEEPFGTGTCFVIDQEGYALTNKHVIETVQKMFRADLLREKIKKELQMEIVPKVWVFFDAKRYAAEIASTSDNFDMAVLKIDKRFKNYLRMSSTDLLPRGERVAAFGFPGIDRNAISEDELIQRLKNQSERKESIRKLFEPRDFLFSRTDGTAAKVSTERGGSVMIQHTARINRGNSGGPLLSTDGVVRGINTLALTGGADHAEAPLFYAVSVGQLKEELFEQIPGAEWK